MPDQPSLDALLQQIQSNTALQLEPEKPEHTAPPTHPQPTTVAGGEVSATVAMRAPTEGSSVPPEAESSELWQTNLTPRQRALPKISAQMLSGLVAIMVMIAGVGAATMLSQRNQDIRQQAFEDTTPDLTGPSATITQDESQVAEQAAATEFSLDSLLTRQWLPLEIVMVVGAVIGIVFLITILLWVLGS